MTLCAFLLFACGGDDDGPADAATDTSVDSAMDTGATDTGTDAACPDLDDGVDCTVDTCEDGLAVHTPDDAACEDMTMAPTCDEGRLVQDIGVCDETSGCMAEETLVEDCTLEPPLAMCTGSAAGGDLTHLTAGRVCDDSLDTPACVQPGTLCEATSPDACESGMLTVAEATCDTSTGCGETSATEDCPTRPARCEGPVHLTYAPSCADATSCSPTGAETRTPCPTPPTSCEGEVHTTWAASCDAVDGCGATPLLETDCDAMDSRECTGPASYSTTNCSCDVGTTCNCSTRDRLCPIPSRCSGARRIYEVVECTGAGVCGIGERTEMCPSMCCMLGDTALCC